MYRILCLLLLCSFSAFTQGIYKNSAAFEAMLRSNAALVPMLDKKAHHNIQIIYTQINRDRHNRPTFAHQYFNVSDTAYFNPASTVKLPAAAMALETINKLNHKGITKYTTLEFDSSYAWQKPYRTDASAPGGKVSVAQLIRQVFLVSENEPYNRLYQISGQQRLNEGLWAKGYKATMLSRQFLGLSPEQNAITNAYRFLDANGRTIYTQAPQQNPHPLDFSRKVFVGKGHIRGEQLVHEPIDFSGANRLPLQDLQRMLQAILFPQSLPAAQRFHLTMADYQFLRQYLSQYPGETNYPKYDREKFPDNYVKYFFNKTEIPAHVRIFNKVGWAYGYLTDVSYVVDFKNKVEFMLTATIYANEDGILNDDKYNEEDISLPFLHELGQTVYRHELARKRTYRPNLANFKLNYETRNTTDTRPTLKEVAN